MNKFRYKCSMCSKLFTRKWNAQRHNNNLHGRLARINRQFKTDMITLNKQSQNRSQYNSNLQFKESYHNFKNNTYPPVSSFKKASNSIYQKKVNIESIQFMDEDEKENLLYDKLEKMAVPFEKLNKLFIEAPHLIIPYTIEGILSNIITTALGEPDPVKVVQNYLAYYNRLYYRNKMIYCVSKSKNMNTMITIEYLKNLLLDRYTYR